MNAQSKTKSSSSGQPSVNTIRSVGIIGAGQMGNGIAHVVALAGYKVLLNDVAKERVDAALGIIQRNMARQVSRGSLKDSDVQNALKRISYAASFADFGNCDLVIEAATE